jgi:hypothetical protein
MKRLFDSYVGLWRLIAAQWTIYGGLSALITSPYLHLSIILTAVGYHLWSVEGWWDLPLSVLPNLLGFTLGGYALLMGVGGDEFRRKISGAKQSIDGQTKESPFLLLNASYLHFLTVQAAALLTAVMAKAAHGSEFVAESACLQKLAKVYWATGFMLFIYSLALTFAAVLSVFRVGKALDTFNPDQKHESRGGSQPPLELGEPTPSQVAQTGSLPTQAHPVPTKRGVA